MINHNRNAILNTLALVTMLVVNVLANTLPINGMTTGEVSARYSTLFTPAGITFSIWSVIYLLLLGFICMQWTKRDAYVYAEVSRLFWLSCILNSCWILAWHFLKITMSVTLMLLLLLTLIQLFLRVKKISMNSFLERLLIRLPFTIYLAWICVATIANVAALLVSNQWDGFFLSNTGWTIVMMSAASLLAILVASRFRVPSFALVVMWALFGIFLRWNDSENQIIAHAALWLLLLLASATVLAWRRTRPFYAWKLSLRRN